jgi:hypothetical protein
VNKLDGSKANEVEQKFHFCFSKKTSSCILEGEDLVNYANLNDLTVGNIICQKHARLTSSEVEHYFLNINPSSMITHIDL